MVDIRRDTITASALQVERNKYIQYAGNAAATFIAVLGLCMLVMFSSPHDKAEAAEHISAAAQLSAPADLSDLTPQQGTIVRTGVLTQTVTALDAMEVLGADRQQADAALEALRDEGFISKKGLSSGLKISVHLASGVSDENGRQLKALTLRPEPGRSVIAKRQPDGSYLSAELTSRLSLGHRRFAGLISSSLSNDLQRAGASNSEVSKFLSVFAYNTNVPRALAKGDRFELVQEVWEDERGQVIDTGDIVFASLEGDAVERAFYRYTPSDNGITDYFDADGDSAERFLMRKPVRGAPVSSRFGRRIHPIGGYAHVHKGVDFRAPMSARIYAAGDGVVEKMGRNGGYGRHVLIRHANGYKTGYAHMSGYSRQLYPGAKVKQGDLVGFVGSTGHSTGPHLHYEVILNGRHVDPMALQLPTGRKLAAKPAIQSDFDQHRREIDKIRRQLGAGIEIASTGGHTAMGGAHQAEAP